MARSLPFALARRNFYEAARAGLDATCCGPRRRRPRPRPVGGARAGRGACCRSRGSAWWAAASTRDEADDLLAVIAARVEARATGSAWQRAALAALERRMARPRRSPR